MPVVNSVLLTIGSQPGHTVPGSKNRDSLVCMVCSAAGKTFVKIFPDCPARENFSQPLLKNLQAPRIHQKKYASTTDTRQKIWGSDLLPESEHFTSDERVAEGHPYPRRSPDLDTSLPGMWWEYYPPGIVSGLISAPDCPSSPVSDRPVSGFFPCSVTGNPSLHSDGGTEVIPKDKTGLYGACLL